MARPQSPSPRWRPAPPDHQLPPASEPEPEVSRPGIGGLIRSLADDMGTLVRQEIRLAKLETERAAKRLAADGAWIGAGAAIAAVGGLTLVVAMALALGALLGAYWLGTLITGVLLVFVGALVAWKGIRDLRRGDLAPSRTRESLREDADWARREMREFKEELTRE